jgi:hypothetical protein
MGQFKPMVKMYTDEPSVILKLKKGGKVSKMAMGGNDFVPMQSSMTSGMPSTAAPMGMAPKKPSMAMRRRAMNPNLLMKKGGKAEKHEDAAQDRAMIKKALAGKKFASGGAIDKAETRTTIESGAKKYAKTKMDTAHKDRAHGTGQIKEGKPGGYATGGAIPADTNEKVNKGKIKMKGTIEGNEKDYVNTQMHQAKRDKAHGTGGIKESNAGGFKRGGKVPGIGRAIEGGNWENRPADTAHAGKQNGTTGGVKEANAGGYKHGGKASKKHYATGGNVVSDGKAEKMPRHFLSRPVANSLQSGTFAKGGKVDFYSDLAKKMQKDPEKPNLRLVKTHTGPKGHVAKVYKDKDYGEYRTKFYSPEGKHHTKADSHTDDLEDAHMTAMHEVNKGYKRGGKISHKAEGGLQDLSKGQYDRSIGPSEEDMDMAKAIRSVPRKLYEGAKDMLGFGTAPKPTGSVTKTEKSVTVTPASKKRGGKC